MLRFLLWRLLGLLAALGCLALLGWFADGGLSEVLRGPAASRRRGAHVAVSVVSSLHRLLRRWPLTDAIAPARSVACVAFVLLAATAIARWRARRRRRYVRVELEAYRADSASAAAIAAMFEVLHKRLLRRWWRRLIDGQPSVALEVHHGCTLGSEEVGREENGRSPRRSHVWLAVSCPQGLQGMVQTALQAAYPNCRMGVERRLLCVPRAMLRLKKREPFIKRVKVLDHFEHERQPPVNRLMTVLGACDQPAFVQLALTPAPLLFERLAKRSYKRHEARLSRGRSEHLFVRDRSMVEDVELRGGLQVQHRPLFFTELRVVAARRDVCEHVASELRAEGAENRLVERGTTVRHGLLGLYVRRLRRGEGNPLPSFVKGVLASTELAALWQLPSTDYATVPFARASLPLAPAAPAILRPGDGRGTLCDALGAVSIHEQLRKQNTAVPGTVEQGKSSYLVATIAEDLRRDRCAVVVIDPKGDAADAAVSVVPPSRTCTLLDLSHPTCGFNPLAVDAPADVIADYVVGALKNLFTDADIRASSDRYLRNAIIAVVTYNRRATLWDAARLLSVGEEGYAYRRAVGARVRTLPEFKEIAEFFTAELSAQLADARSATTAKLDAPVNKLARLLNSPSIKHVLLNDSLRIDFDRVIADEQVLVVKGALGAMGAGNTSVLMQLLVGMLDAALARQQDLVPVQRRVAVALKVDEAPLVINRGFAETMALKRSAGLETVACWQADSQWIDRDVREQLDALFAHRVYFATASARDARSAVQLTMAEFSDTVRPDTEHLSALGRPDVRLRLPRHHAIASWVTPGGRQPPFIAKTIPLAVDRERLELHADKQRRRGARHRTDLRQPHWDRGDGQASARGAHGGSPAPVPQADAPAVAKGPPPPGALPASLPSKPSDSYRELADVDGARSVRWAKRPPSPGPLKADPLDLDIIALVAGLRHVLSSQIHRRFNSARAVTTTQRRLKRLSDAGLVERFQFHRPDGGGVPMCYVITSAGRELLGTHLDGPVRAVAAGGADTRRKGEAGRLCQARHDVHVAGWVLALEQIVGRGQLTLRGEDQATLSPPLYAAGEGRVAIGPGQLRLPGGRVPHDFLRSDASGGLVEVERFETVRPDAIVEVPAGSDTPVDLIVELDDRIAESAGAKLRRYDHFLAGWSMHTARYGRRLEALPVVVFVCRDRARARECARRADSVLAACRAYAGEYPLDWAYPGRERTLFVAERDVHEGLLCAYGVPSLPPPARVSAAHDDPRAGEAVIEPREILDACAHASR